MIDVLLVMVVSLLSLILTMRWVPEQCHLQSGPVQYVKNGAVGSALSDPSTRTGRVESCGGSRVVGWLVSGGLGLLVVEPAAPTRVDDDRGEKKASVPKFSVCSARVW